MTTRPRVVDYGPISLQVGEEAVPQTWTQPGANAEGVDVARFESLLHRETGHDDDTELAPEALLGPRQAADVEEFGSTDDVGTEIAHVWVNSGLQGVREVRVGLGRALLPETSLRLFESAGALRIEFTCGTHRVAEWLDRKLPALAADLGTRLRRRVQLSLSMSDGTFVGESAAQGGAA